MSGIVVAVSRSPAHTVSKPTQPEIQLLAGLGVDGDAHLGTTVQHRSRVARAPSQPNLRQVHLIHAELYDELVAIGFDVSYGRLGENITTRGIDLLDLPTGAQLLLGSGAVIEITGLRNPCVQLNGVAPGLLAAVVDRAPDGTVIRRCGIMGVVLTSAPVRPGDPIRIIAPAEPHRPLEPV
ncbi:MAG TPA: MOSC domain-containing protein [Actinomycetes bacterium]|nr:MOSC domain-containing protein [Actinomycetes bacterium]